LQNITKELDDAFKVTLEIKNVPTTFYVGMHYWYFFPTTTLEHNMFYETKKDNLTNLVMLPLYPQFSI